MQRRRCQERDDDDKHTTHKELEMTSLFSNKLSLLITQVMSYIQEHSTTVLLKASDHFLSIGSRLVFNIETVVGRP